MDSRAEIGSKTAKGGFAVEAQVEAIFNDWKENPLAHVWLSQMGYDISKIEKLLALKIPVRIKKLYLSKYGFETAGDFMELQKFKKADIQVQLYIQLDGCLKLENISVKKANKGANFNQIDKRPVAEYQKMWSFDDGIAHLLKLFTGEEKVCRNTEFYREGKKRLFLDEFSVGEQEKIINFFSMNKFRIVADLVRGRGGFSADWILVCETFPDSSHKVWKLVEINNALNFLCQGDVHITPRGSLSVGRIFMQRKGGTPDPTSLQFKMAPLDLFQLE